MTDTNKSTKKVEDEEVMITSSISDLEKMLEGVEKIPILNLSDFSCRL